MNEKHNNGTFEAAISIIAYKCMLNEAQVFLNQDVSNIDENPRFKQKLLKNLHKHSKGQTRLSALKIALVACLIALSLLFTACMCIPEIRESIWNVLVEWYDDHISVNFSSPEQSTDEITDAQGGDDTLPNKEPPDTIEEKAVATYLPVGYYLEESMSSVGFVNSIVYDENGKVMFRIVQSVIEQDTEIDIDNENDPITKVDVNGQTAILTEYPDNPGVYSITWQDGNYVYAMHGTFPSICEMIKIAEGIELQ